MNILDLDKDECCGCGACKAKCPANAINMELDSKGFYYPVVDETKCINCSLCLDVCDFKNKANLISTNIFEVYAFQHSDKRVLSSSSSGGAFTAICDYILSNNGIVYGARLDPKSFEVLHDYAENKSDCEAFKQSKYVQSQMFNVFKTIKANLSTGRLVLFVGTPCQCAAIKVYLQNIPDNLIIVDLLCHGVSSNEILKDHIHFWENKKGKKAINYEYRSKKYGYDYTQKITFADGSSNTSIDLKRFLKLYSKTMRDSCYNCKYTTTFREADITIGDLWDSASKAQIYNNRGTSIIFFNSDRGLSLRDEILKNGRTKQLELSDIHKQAISHSVKKPREYDKLWNDYEKYGYEYILKKYAPYSVLSWGYNTLWRILHIFKLDGLAQGFMSLFKKG